MEQFSTEEQQAEALRNWLKQNGSSIAIGVGLGLLIMFGVDRWQSYRSSNAEAASLQYMNLRVAAAADDAGPVVAQAERLRDDYSDSAYATLGGLFAAQAALQSQPADLDTAARELYWAMENAPVEGLRQIARVRLARVKLEQGDGAGALSLLQAGEAGAFAGVYAEIEGDIAVAQGDTEQARGAYARALASRSGGNTALLTIKLDNLGGSAG